MNKKFFGYGLSFIVVISAVLGVVFPQIFFTIRIEQSNVVQENFIVEIFKNSGWIKTLKENGYYKYSFPVAITLVIASLVHVGMMFINFSKKVKGHIIRSISFVIVACCLILMAEAYHVGSSEYLQELRKNIILGTHAKFGIGLGIYFIILTMITSVGIAIKPSFYTDELE